VIGTIVIIILAWQKSLIKEPLKEINKMRANGFWLSDQLFEQIKEEIAK
jgi:predicted nucleic acid-binding protein